MRIEKCVKTIHRTIHTPILRLIYSFKQVCLVIGISIVNDVHASFVEQSIHSIACPVNSRLAIKQAALFVLNN